ncbi:cell division protein ZapA [Psychrobacter sp. ANT_WB68]|uniref:cell division protein ZapA n=1 Tax=Psychrobacter sp. ANT_WB68 TaxID=2597355 RepID=UPI0011F2C2DA|nr:cell division protein ZapA [Psychrobacter sp. ANT_WB68]KAA0915122.1 cell division protein ZapA [Psychrobacter sp. ANT_WB68]
MTDDRANPVDNQSQKAMPNNSNTHSSNAENSNAARPIAKAENAPAPQIKKVDIAIAGVTYPIYCPVHEQEELLSAVSYINDFALKLRKDAPNLSQENLLVLSCLNLYEKIQTHERNEEDRLQKNKQSEVLLNKIMKDAHSIL